MVPKDGPIAIVGGGAWGLSTALHLTNAGYTDITVFERAEVIPSPYSAAWDINKIVRAEYEDPFYTKLALVSFNHLSRCSHLHGFTHIFHLSLNARYHYASLLC